MLIGCLFKHENLIYIKVFLFIFNCEKQNSEAEVEGFYYWVSVGYLFSLIEMKASL